MECSTQSARAAGDFNPARLPLGEWFMGRYRVVRCIALGGMGAVYEVVHRETERALALKVLLPLTQTDQDARERFCQEARVTARVRSDHIVDVVDAGVDDETGMPFLVMELLSGEDLGTVLAEGPVSKELTVTLLGQVAVALDRCHGANVVHRDLKPSNIMVTERDDGSPLAKILDFGVAKVLKPGAMTTGTRSVGTTLFMAPEQLTGDSPISAATDRYALAQLAFAMLVGKAYFQAEADVMEPYPLLSLVAAGPGEPASERAGRLGGKLPRSLDAWFARASSVDPSNRPPSACELVRDLAAALDVEVPRHLARGAPVGTARPHDPSPVAGQRSGSARSRPSRLVGAALAVLVVGTAAGAWWHAVAADQQEQPPTSTAGAAADELAQPTPDAARAHGLPHSAADAPDEEASSQAATSATQSEPPQSGAGQRTPGEPPPRSAAGSGTASPPSSPPKSKPGSAARPPGGAQTTTAATPPPTAPSSSPAAPPVESPW